MDPGMVIHIMDMIKLIVGSSRIAKVNPTGGDVDYSYLSIHDSIYCSRRPTKGIAACHLLSSVDFDLVINPIDDSDDEWDPAPEPQKRKEQELGKNGSTLIKWAKINGPTA
jgi:hypothetical protein